MGPYAVHKHQLAVDTWHLIVQVVVKRPFQLHYAGKDVDVKDSLDCPFYK